jgi:hypothetical protein
LRGRARDLRAADSTLSQEAAERRALEDLSAEDRAALEQSEASRVAQKFREFEGACALGSIICRLRLPQHILDEAGAYPRSRFDVPLPEGPFNVQKSALSAATRLSPELQRIARANRAMWPEFDRALARAERRGEDWVYDENGVAWQVHHIKPVGMGGDGSAANLIPLPLSVHSLYTNWWNGVLRGFRRRFTDAEWDAIYTTSSRNVPGSRVRVTPR